VLPLNEIATEILRIAGRTPAAAGEARELREAAV
jgi:hypothetical protein